MRLMSDRVGWENDETDMKHRALENLRKRICTDKDFNGVDMLRVRDIEQLKSHVPFLVYNDEINETLVILDVFTIQVIKDNKPSEVKTRLKYLKWDTWTEASYGGFGSWDDDYPEYISCSGWVEKTVSIDNFDLTHLCCAFLPTEKQFNCIKKEDVYDLPEERVLLTSGIEAFVRIREVCDETKKLIDKQKKNRYTYSDYDSNEDYEMNDYVPIGPWGE